MERKLISEADSRPLVVLDPRAPASPEALDAAVRAAALARRALRPPHAAARCCCPGDRRAHDRSSPTCSAWPRAHVRLALIDERTGPALAAAQNRRGLVVYVAARAVDRPPRGLGRTPGGCLLVVPGAAAGPPRGARGRGLPRLRRRPHRRRRRGGRAGGRRVSTLDRAAAGARRRRARAATPRPRAARPAPRPLPRSPSRAAIAFVALAAFGVLHWMAMLEPAEPGRALGRASASGCSRCAALLARRAAAGPLRRGRRGRRRRSSRSRWRCSPAASPTSCCARRAGASWPAASARGIADAARACACPTAASTSGRAVIPLGGTRARASPPRCSRSGRGAARLGLPARRAGAARPLYAVPAVALDFTASSCAARCWRCWWSPSCGWRSCARRDVPAAGAARRSRRARRADRRARAQRATRPWFDYETWALETSASQVDGVHLEPQLRPAELAARRARAAARARPSSPAYWKAENLDDFDGARWRPTRDGAAADARPAAGDDPRPCALDAGRSRSRCATCARRPFITAGSRRRRRRARGATRPDRRRRASRRDRARCAAATPTRARSTRRSRPSASCAPPATDYHAVARGLRYRRSSPRRARRSRADAPAPACACVPFFGALRRPGTTPSRPARRRRVSAHEPAARLLDAATCGASGARAAAQARRGDAGRLRRARRALPRRRASPTPRRRRKAAETLDGFLFDAKTGYCQQYSGAMALLLRMAGIPARVATGFTTGALDRKTSEYVVRDLDAHSWVEVWYPGLRLGHVRPDAGRRARRAASRPTPSAAAAAAAPRRRAAASAATAATPRRARRRRRRATAAPWWRSAIAAGARRARRRASAASLPCAAGAAARRRRCRELERALRARAPRRRPGHDAARARGALRRHPRRRGLRARAARSALPRRARRQPDPRAAPRAARRARPRAAVWRPAARLVGAAAALTALPAAPTLGRDGRCLRPLSARDGAARGRALPPGDRAAGEGPRPRAREDLDPRGARPRVLPLAPASRRRAREFEAVVERAPTNDYALFCLGRALMQLGRHARGAQAARARRHHEARAARLPDLPRPRARASAA